VRARPGRFVRGAGERTRGPRWAGGGLAGGGDPGRSRRRAVADRRAAAGREAAQRLRYRGGDRDTVGGRVRGEPARAGRGAGGATGRLRGRAATADPGRAPAGETLPPAPGAQAPLTPVSPRRAAPRSRRARPVLRGR